MGEMDWGEGVQDRGVEVWEGRRGYGGDGGVGEEISGQEEKRWVDGVAFGEG